MLSKSLKAIVVLTAFTAVFAGGASAQMLEVDTLSIPMQSNPAFAPVAVALEKGWFTEAGFKNINNPTFVSGNAAGEALMSGDLSVWLPGNVPVISMRHNGRPVVIAGDLSVAHNEALMIRRDANVTKPEDLYNITIGLVMGGTPGAVMQAVALDNGLDPTKLKLVNLAPPEDATALRNNEIQGILVWPPHPYNVQDVAEYSFDSKKYSHTRVPIAFNEDYVRDNPNATKAIVEVLYRAQQYVIEHPDEAQEILAKRTDQPLDLVKTMWNDYWAPGPDYGVIGDGFVEDYTAYTNFLAANGSLAQDPIPVLNYTYTGILEEIRPDIVKVKGNWKP
jgi:ABC-type nitrate/sulfonate/bicarbonate transport system substrate-binding protein